MYTELQRRVLQEAKERLKAHGIEGVCTDELRTDAEIFESYEEAVSALVLDTLYWEGPVLPEKEE